MKVRHKGFPGYQPTWAWNSPQSQSDISAELHERSWRETPSMQAFEWPFLNMNSYGFEIIGHK